MEGKGSFFNIVLLFILAFLSLTLAGLAGYVFLGGGGGGQQKAPQTVVAVAETKAPADDELAEYPLYEDKTMFNLKITDPNNAMIPIIQVTAGLDYLAKAPKASSIKDPHAKLEKYKEKIKSLIGTYFQELTREDAIKTEAKENASKKLTQQINDLINANEEKKAKIVYEVIFSYWLVT